MGVADAIMNLQLSEQYIYIYKNNNSKMKPLKTFLIIEINSNIGLKLLRKNVSSETVQGTKIIILNKAKLKIN